MPEIVVITDTSVLINFLVLDQVELLGRLPDRRCVVTDHVRGEIREHYGEQLQRLERAFACSILEEIRVTDLIEVKVFAQLTKSGLGVGECSAVAVAMHRKLAVAIDDRRAIKKIKKPAPALAILTTETLVVLLVRGGALTIEEADRMKRDLGGETPVSIGIREFRGADLNPYHFTPLRSSVRRPKRTLQRRVRVESLSVGRSLAGTPSCRLADRPKEQQPDADLDRSGKMHVAGGWDMRRTAPRKQSHSLKGASEIPEKPVNWHPRQVRRGREDDYSLDGISHFS